MQSAMTAKLTEVIRDQISTLPRWPQSMDRVEWQLRVESIAASTSRYKQPQKSALRKSLQPIDKSQGLDQDSFSDEYATLYAIKLAEMEEQQWRSLWFPTMDDREDQIAEAELKTFDWILRPPQDRHHAWDDFSEWLKTGSAVYWVSGKAGSGKSTLMKYLKRHREVQELLTSWAAGDALIIASFFFWYNGKELQKTQDGLLRSLLYQCLQNHRELIPVVLSEGFDAPLPEIANWTLPRLKGAFKRLLEQQVTALKIFMLVDGLDEYAGDHSEIAELFRHTTHSINIKICVSSRPLIPFDLAFKTFPTLVLQNLTFRDIQTYVKNRLNDDENFKDLEIREPDLGKKLALQVVSKASGVFIWVKLVVQSLIEGIHNCDRGVDLARRLDELPDDLEELYWHMLERVKPTWYLEEGFKLLRLVQAAVIPLSLLQLTFAEMETTGHELENMSVERQNALCKGMAGRVKSRCLGLLEVTDFTCPDEKYRRVQFLHKSVKDFLETPRVASRIQGCLSRTRPFVPELAIIRALLAELKTLRSRLHTQSILQHTLARNVWFTEVRPIVSEAVHYAAATESKDPVSRSACKSLITEIDRFATELWDAVRFKSNDEELGIVHWSNAPRVPGGDACPPIGMSGTSVLAEDDNVVRNDDPEGSSALPADVETGLHTPTKSEQPSLVHEYEAFPRQIRFAGLPEPQCYPGRCGDDNEGRPERRWPHENIWDSPLQRAELNSVMASNYLRFARDLGLEKYADSKTGAPTNGMIIGPTSSAPGKSISVTGADCVKASSNTGVRVTDGRRNPWRKIRKLWARKQGRSGQPF